MIHSFHQHPMGRQNQLHSTSGVGSSLGAQPSFDMGSSSAQQQHAHNGQGIIYATGGNPSGAHLHLGQMTSPPKIGGSLGSNAISGNTMMHTKVSQ